MAWFRAVLSAVALLPVLQARPSYVSEVPNGGNVASSGAIGHIRSGGGGARNQFGTDFQNAGFKWTTALCQKDSDGDGLTNGVELGDPNCQWTKGSTPEFTAGITHPGQADSQGRALDSCDNFTIPATATVKNVSFMFPTTNVPAHPTTYLKFAFNSYDLFAAQHGAAPTKSSFGVRFVPIVTTEAVHHMILYKCSAIPQDFVAAPIEGPMPCSQMKYAWAVGGKDFCLPPSVGVVFEKERTNSWYALEIHYDNPESKSTITDTSGVKIMMIEENNNLAFQNAGFLMIGSKLSALSIPPRQSVYHVTASATIPKTAPTITAFSWILHSHKLGRKLWLTHERGNQYLRDAGCDAKYDFDLQEIIPFEKHFEIQAKDKLTMNCVFNSSDKTEVTLGGDETNNEMCIGFVVYYPEVQASSFLTTPKAVTSSIKGEHTCCMGDKVTCVKLTAATVPGWVVAHAVLMMMAWMVLAPLGIIVSMTAREILDKGKWYQYHRTLMLSVVVLCVAGAALAIASSPVHMDNPHKIVGVIVSVLALLQPINAFLRPHNPDKGAAKSTVRVAWEIFHKNAGRLAYVGAVVNVILAGSVLQLYGGNSVAVYASTCVLLAMAVVVLTVLCCKKKNLSSKVHEVQLRNMDPLC